MTAKNSRNEPRTPPASVPKDKVSKLKTGVRKASLGGVENLLFKLGIPESDWLEVLPWLIREQGAEIGHQWQLVTAFVNGLEEALPIDDAVWLLENLGAELAFRGKESVLHGATLLLPESE